MNKEAILILIDIGKSMYQASQIDQSKSRLEMAIKFSELLIVQKMFNSKQTEIGLISFGDSDPDLQNQMGIDYFQQLEKPSVDYVSQLRDLYKKDSKLRSISPGGDIFFTLDSAIATIDAYVGKKKITKRIFIFSNGSGESNLEEFGIKKLIQSANIADVRITFIPLDFMVNYDPINNITEQEQNYYTDIQQENHEKIQQIKNSLEEKVSIVPNQYSPKLFNQFRSRTVGVRAGWRGNLILYEGKEANQSLQLNIVIYKKTSEEKIPSLKTFSKAADFDKDITKGQIVKDVVQFLNDDPEMKPIEKEQTVKAYFYGNKLVPLSKVYEEQIVHQVPKCMKLLCFTNRNNIPRHFLLKDVEMVLPGNEKNSEKEGLNSLILGCLNLNKVMIVRYVYREKSGPKLCVLFPHETNEYRCFYMAELPSQESIRDYLFSSLKDSSDYQMNVVGDLIESMDLSNFNDDDDPNDDEGFKMKNIFNPTRQYFYQVVCERALSENPEDENQTLPEISEDIKKYLHFEKKVWEKSKVQAEQVAEAFGFQEKEIKQFSNNKIFWKDLFKLNQIQQQQEEKGSLNEDEIEKQKEIFELMKAGKKFVFDEQNVREISFNDPVRDFQKMITNKKVDLTDEAIDQMKKIIIKQINSAVDDSSYTKAIDCLKSLRQTSIEEDEFGSFNEFIKKLKNLFKDSDHSKFWKLVVQNEISLIDSDQNRRSQVSPQEAQQFLHEGIQKQQISSKGIKNRIMEQEEDDLD